MIDRPRLLDLFCGAGGAAMGYHRAGFEVVGVDIKPQPHYPFEFHQADAMTYPLDGFDAYHASPPCQGYIHLKRGEDLNDYPLLIDDVRLKLIDTRKPFVIENVPAAKELLVNPLLLCGTMFGLPIWRHRYFEMSPPIYPLLNTCNHKLGTIEFEGEKIMIPVFISAGGDGKDGVRPSRQGIRWRPRQKHELRCRAMGIDWMTTRAELTEAIPPAYTEYIGLQLMEVVRL